MRLPDKKPAPRTETSIVAEIRAAINAVPGCLAMRNNVGALEDKNGRLVMFGLATGSSDLICICWGRFVAIEIKRTEKLAKQNDSPRSVKGDMRPNEHLRSQLEFISMIEKFGGVGGVAWDVSSAIAIVERARPVTYVRNTTGIIGHVVDAKRA